MKKLWVLSLIFLLLGNAFDGLVTYWGVQVYGIDREASRFAQSIMIAYGLEAALVVKLIIGGIVLLLVFLFVFALSSVVFGYLYGAAISSVIAFWLGIYLFLGGLSWLVTGSNTSILIWIFLFHLMEPLLELLLPLTCIVLLVSGRGMGGLIGRLWSRLLSK